MWVFLSYEECVCRGLHAAARAEEETKRLSTHGVYLAGIPSAHVSLQGAVPAISWPRQTSSATALILYWVSPRHKLCTTLYGTLLSVCVCAHTCVCAHACVHVCARAGLHKLCHWNKVQNSKKEFSVRGLQKPTRLFNWRIWTELES